MPLSRRTFLSATVAAPIVAFVANRAAAETPPYYAEGGVAVDGTDVVAYFTDTGPVKGNAAHAVDWMGATWHFATEANLQTFMANPKAYAPQYGGYCAWAVSQGYTASTTPEAWKIVDGKLYLNYSRRVQRRWERDIPGNIAAADENWPQLLRA